MIISEAVFIMSNAKIEALPKPDFPEYAFVGRSNVGKSSLINMLTQKKGLAKTSGKPGKTITINHFLINKTWYLVDLPGYGYAKRARTEREKWKNLMSRYLLERSNLIYTFILVDIRVEPQQSDIELMEWMAEKSLPFVIIFTKSDKLGRTSVDKAIAVYKKHLLQTWEELPLIHVSSATTGMGRSEILDLIDGQNQEFLDYSSSIIT
jgi:GTP-binding protein